MMNKRIVLVAMLMGSGLLSFTDLARAAVPSPVSDACHHYLPNGAHIYHPSGEVYLDEKLVAIYPDADCTGSGGGADTVGGWAQYIQGAASDSYASNLQNPAEFDALYVDWFVPAGPLNTSDISYESLWPGLGGNGLLLQPVIQANPSMFLGWEAWSEATNKPGCNGGCWDDQAAHLDTSEGDGIIGNMLMTGGGYGTGSETWEILTVDANTGESSLLIETRNGFAPFNQAQYGVLEVHGLTSCAGLPDQNGEWFYLDGVWQAGNSGSPPTYVNVSPDVDWAGHAIGGTPSCSWSGSYSTGATAVENKWSP